MDLQATLVSRRGQRIHLVYRQDCAARGVVGVLDRQESGVGIVDVLGPDRVGYLVG